MAARDVISISPYVAQYYGRQLRGRLHDIPNAIAEQYFEVQRAPEAGRILFAGRLIPRKGVVDLIRAVALAGTSVRRVVLAGSLSDIEYVAQLRVEVDRLGLTGVVDFRGLLDETEMLQEFAKAELLALPSYQETAPMVIQQAMASGVPIVASAICGVPFQVEHGRAGLLHEAGDVASLAESLRRLTTEPGLSDRFGAAAKISAEARYRAGNVATATLAAYRTVLMNR
jgi:glycosyltransferase involved in cell wall biosynthesis